jgi:anti-sigma regulatory factor (Ser/Thr protein kinase)
MKYSPSKTRRNAIRRFIIDHVRENSPHLTELVKNEFKISRQAAFRRIHNLVREGYLKASGRTQNRVYQLGKKRILDLVFSLDNKVSEEMIWAKHFSVLFRGLKDNIASICEYGLTEMVNNAIDHSEGTSIRVMSEVKPHEITILIGDNGVGIFKKIQREMKLSDPQHSLLELAKGKYTTDPAHHTGEGIFFTSKMFDKFLVRSGELSFLHHVTSKYDTLTLDEIEKNGTQVFMILDPLTQRTPKGVFDSFAEREMKFDKTIVPVELAKYEGGSLISRSQGKRLVSRFENFRNVVLDFKNVASIGRPFADEVFRVFANKHKKTKLARINTTKDVENTIKSITSNHA